MKKFMTLLIGAGAIVGMGAITASPADAGGWSRCGYSGYRAGACCPQYYRPAATCCPRYYRVVRHYRPIVRKVTLYRVVGYQPVVARRLYRPCCQ